MRLEMLMNASVWRTGLILAVVIPLAAACSRDTTRMGGPQPGISGVSAAPTQPVSAQQLPPPGAASDQQVVTGMPWDQTGQGEQMAALPPPTEAPAREDVLGQWSLSGPSDACQLNVALTSWEGGYRASTRGCTSPELTSVGAWNIESDLVVLKDNEGNPVARLARTGTTRFDGRLELGGSVSMSR